MDSKQQFYSIISDAYTETVGTLVDTPLLETIIEELTDHFYQQYVEFSKKFPKSKKRYATFDTKDLQHPYTFERIIEIAKDQLGNEYAATAAVILGMTLAELQEFEQQRKAFYNMF